MSDLKKAQYYLASYQALSNAAEMIRGHGEEGFSFLDKAFDEAYQKQTKKLAKQLDERASVFSKKYELMGIDIDCAIGEGY